MNSTPILIQPDIVTLSPAVNLALCASVVQSPTIDRGKTRPAATTPAALPRRLFCTEYRHKRSKAKQQARALERRRSRCGAQTSGYARWPAGDGARTGRRHASAGAVQDVGCERARKPSEANQFEVT